MGHVRDLWTDPKPVGARTRPRNDRWGRGKRWLATWSVDGRVRSKAFAAKDAAEDWVRARDLGIPQERRGSSLTVRELAELWQSAQVHHRPSTARSVTSTLSVIILPSLGDVALSDLDRARLQEAVSAWSGRWSPARIRVAWSYVTSMLRMAELDGLIERRPAGVRLPAKDHKPVVPLSTAQVVALEQAMPPRWASLVVVGAASGLRGGELRGLTWDRVVDGVLVVDRQMVGTDGRDPVFGPPKSVSSRRRVPIGPLALDALERQRVGWPSSDLVWRTRLGSPLSRTAASEVWRHAVTAAGLELRTRSGWHELRHFHASLLIAAGLSPVAVAHRLGHKDATETLRTYAHLWPTDETRAVEVVEAELSKTKLADRDRAGNELAEDNP